MGFIDLLIHSMSLVWEEGCKAGGGWLWEEQVTCGEPHMEKDGYPYLTLVNSNLDQDKNVVYTYLIVHGVMVTQKTLEKKPTLAIVKHTLAKYFWV